MLRFISFVAIAFSLAHAAVIDSCAAGAYTRCFPSSLTENIHTGNCSDVVLSSRACPPPASVNAATIALIKQAEGFVASPAPDPIGLPTVGFGHLCQTTNCAEVPFAFPLTQAEATTLLNSDLKTPIACINNDVSASIRLNDNQFGALVSWAFNEGCGNAGSSTLISRLNQGQDPDTVAAQELPKWDLAGGQVLPGLVTRRAAEVKLFQTASSVIVHPSC